MAESLVQLVKRVAAAYEAGELNVVKSEERNERNERNEKSPLPAALVSFNSFISSPSASSQPTRGPLNANGLRERYEERAAICEHEGGAERAFAEALAWLAVATIWYDQHGVRTPACLCAGCGEPITDELSVLLLPHGERAHTGDGYNCIRRYGRRWHAEAAVALAAIDIPPPREIIANIEGGSNCRDA